MQPATGGGSWIDLKSLKNAIRHPTLTNVNEENSFNESNYSDETNTLREYLCSNTSDKCVTPSGEDELKQSAMLYMKDDKLNNDDTPMYNSNGSNQEGNIASFVRTKSQENEVSVNNFKRKRNMTEHTLQQQQSTSVHKRKQSQVIDLSNKLIDVKNNAHLKNKKSLCQLQVLDEDQGRFTYNENKENQNPFKNRRPSISKQYETEKPRSSIKRQSGFPPPVPQSAKSLKEQVTSMSDEQQTAWNSGLIPNRVVDKGLDQIKERIDRLKNHGHSFPTKHARIDLCLEEETDILKPEEQQQAIVNEVIQASIVSISDSRSSETVINHENLTHSQIDLQSYTSTTDLENYSDSQLSKQQSPCKSVDISNASLNFKRHSRKPSDQQKTESNHLLLELRKENHRLTKELDKQAKDHQLILKETQANMRKMHQQELQDQEEEWKIICDGLKQEHSDIISDLKTDFHQKEVNSNKERDLILLEYQNQLELERSAHSNEIDELTNKLSYLQEELERMKEKTLNVKGLLQDIQFTNDSAQSSGDPERLLCKLRNDRNSIYKSQKQLHCQRNLNTLLEAQPMNQFASMENYQSGNNNMYHHRIPEQNHHSDYHNNSTYSINPQHSYNSNNPGSKQKREYAMNFSFSDNLQKKHIQEENVERSPPLEVIQEYKRVNNPSLFKISEPYSPKRDMKDTLHLIIDQPQLALMILDPGCYDFMSPNMGGGLSKKGSQTTTNRKSFFFNQEGNREQPFANGQGFGSENAPDESGFLSEEEVQEHNHRIVNESSLLDNEFLDEDETLRPSSRQHQHVFSSQRDNQSMHHDFGVASSFSDHYSHRQPVMRHRDQAFNMTGKSESAIDDDDQEARVSQYGGNGSLAKSRAINSSNINLKRNLQMNEHMPPLAPKRW